MIGKSDKIHHAHDHGAAVADVVEHANARKIRKVVGIGCVVNAILMAMKMATDYFGHSDALVADGFHSLNDFAADLIMLGFVGISFRGPDNRYSYGYGKFETFSTFLMSSFLIIVSLMIGYEGIESLVDYARGEQLEQPNIWTVIVVLFAIATKEGLYHFYSAAGKKVGSKALVANAWHHRSDALASVATLIGVSFSQLFGPAFRVLDPIASILIAAFILVAACRMLAPAFCELMERSLPEADRKKARECVENTPGVESIAHLRSRRNGHYKVFDIAVRVSPDVSVKNGADIALAVEESLTDQFGPYILPTVSVIPSKDK